MLLDPRSWQTLGVSYLTGSVSKHWERKNDLVFVIRIVYLFYGSPTLCACKIFVLLYGGACQLCLLHFLHCFCKQEEGEHSCLVPTSIFGHLTSEKELILQFFDERKFFHLCRMPKEIMPKINVLVHFCSVLWFFVARPKFWTTGGGGVLEIKYPRVGRVKGLARNYEPHSTVYI